MRPGLLSCTVLFFALFFCLVKPEGLSAAAQYAQDERLTELAQKFSRISGIRSSFIQTNYVSFMDEKIVSAGFFEFHKPDRLIWQYDTPVFFRLEYAGGKASFSNAPSGPQQPGGAGSGREAEIAAVLGRNLMQWIALDLKAIQRDYSVRLVDEAPLRLRFELKKSSPGAIQNIALKFSADRADIQEVLLEGTDGDYILLEFTNSEHYE